MITLVARNFVKPEHLEDFKKTAKSLIEASQKEKGCIEYNLYVDKAMPHVLTFIEKWENKEALDAHGASPHFTSAFPKLKEMCESAEMTVYLPAL